jgi:hypothetical protein
VLDKRAANELADQLDLDGLPMCPMCLFDFAWEIHEGRAKPSTLPRTVNWTWPDLEDALKDAVVGARMREVMHAEAALRDLDERGRRSPLVRVVVDRLARQLASEFRH